MLDRIVRERLRSAVSERKKYGSLSKGSEGDGSGLGLLGAELCLCLLVVGRFFFFFFLSRCLRSDAGNSDQMFETSLRHSERKHPPIQPYALISLFLFSFHTLFSLALKRDGRQQHNPVNGPRSRPSTGIGSIQSACRLGGARPCWCKLVIPQDPPPHC